MSEASKAVKGLGTGLPTFIHCVIDINVQACILVAIVRH